VVAISVLDAEHVAVLLVLHAREEGGQIGRGRRVHLNREGREARARVNLIQKNGGKEGRRARVNLIQKDGGKEGRRARVNLIQKDGRDRASASEPTHTSMMCEVGARSYLDEGDPKKRYEAYTPPEAGGARCWSTASGVSWSKSPAQPSTLCVPRPSRASVRQRCVRGTPSRT
jgi:hypothetical protein